MTKTTPTGRIARSVPQFQNIPIRTPEGDAIKRAFCRMKLTLTPRDAQGKVPHCTHRVCDTQLTPRLRQWRENNYAREPEQCRHYGVYTLDGEVMCGRHVGIKLIEKLLEK